MPLECPKQRLQSRHTSASFTMATSQLELAPRRFALVIGNQSYESLSKLPNTLNDAEAISKKLESLSFEVTQRSNLTRREMTESTEEFMSECALHDISDIVFYFAGHGCGTGMWLFYPLDLVFPFLAFIHSPQFRRKQLPHSHRRPNHRDETSHEILLTG